MGQTVEQLEAHIKNRRDGLDANLRELELKVATVADWRYYFRTHPLAMLGAAFGGAFLLAGLTSRSHDSRPYGTPLNSRLDALDHIKDALIGVASIRLTNFIGQAIPDFAQELKDAKDRSARITSAS